MGLTMIGELTVPGTAGSARRLRALVRDLLGPDHVRRHDVALCLTEMFANAITHTGSGEAGWVSVVFSGAGGLVRVEVVDEGAGGGRPVVRDEGGLEESGRGLLLLAGHCDRWGYDADGPATRVWAEFGTGQDQPPYGTVSTSIALPDGSSK